MNFLLSKKLQKKGENFELPKVSFLLAKTLKISVPAAIEIFFVGLIGLMDTIMVGKLGDAAIASVSISQQPVFITLAACIGLNAGAIAIIARRRGENDRAGANNYLRQIIVLGIIIALILSIVSIIFARPMLKVAGAKSDTIDGATNYFQIVTSALIFNYVRLIITSSLRACGHTQLTLITNITANLINVFLNYCLISGNLGFPALGINGAAIATAIGNAAAFIISFIAIYKSRGFLSIRFRDNWKLDKKSVNQIFKISSNAFVEQLFMRIGFFLIAMIVNNLGTHVVAVNAIISSIISLSFNITDGFSIGASSLVGRSMGEKRNDLAFAYGRLSQILSFFLGILMFTAAVTFRYDLSRLFSKDTSTINDASAIIIYAAFVIFPQSLQWITTGVLRGAGDTKYTARSSLISVTIVRPIFAFILCYPLGLGLLGSWIGMFIDQALRFVLNNQRFVGLKWLDIKI